VHERLPALEKALAAQGAQPASLVALQAEDGAKPAAHAAEQAEHGARPLQLQVEPATQPTVATQASEGASQWKPDAHAHPAWPVSEPIA
jgi:hypothetical protein